jgi:hypothetical protein
MVLESNLNLILDKFLSSLILTTKTPGEPHVA